MVLHTFWVLVCSLFRHGSNRAGPHSARAAPDLSAGRAARVKATSAPRVGGPLTVVSSKIKSSWFLLLSRLEGSLRKDLSGYLASKWMRMQNGLDFQCKQLLRVTSFRRSPHAILSHRAGP